MCKLPYLPFHFNVIKSFLNLRTVNVMIDAGVHAAEDRLRSRLCQAIHHRQAPHHTPLWEIWTG